MAHNPWLHQTAATTFLEFSLMWPPLVSHSPLGDRAHEAGRRPELQSAGKDV